jgi:antitoxin component of RelBE/YafQ-DinJ toxin-antitoxin module
MPGKGTTVRTVRIDAELWAEAQAVAERRGESVSDLIRDCLQRVVARDRREQSR